MIESTQKISDQDSATTTAILCAESLDISSASRLHEVLSDALDSGHPININISEITRIDTSCIQLFFSFIKEAKNRHIDIDWSKDNEIFVETLRLIGLTSIIDTTV